MHGPNGWGLWAKGDGTHIADTIIEPDKRECLMSLLECGDHVVRWNKR
jgi:hypothetical protein